jgi:hypothetical protein
MTSQENCNCDDQCPESTSCMCLYVYDTGRCNCDCFGPIVITPTLKLTDRVAINIRGATLASVGESFGRSSDVQLLIPADRASEPVSISVENETLEYVLDSVGIVIGGPRSPADEP